MKKDSGQGCLIFLILWGIWALVALLIAPWTDRNLDFWASYVRGHPVDVPFFLSYLLTWFLHLSSIFLNIISEVARYFVA